MTTETNTQQFQDPVPRNQQIVVTEEMADAILDLIREFLKPLTEVDFDDLHRRFAEYYEKSVVLEAQCRTSGRTRAATCDDRADAHRAAAGCLKRMQTAMAARKLIDTLEWSLLGLLRRHDGHVNRQLGLVDPIVGACVKFMRSAGYYANRSGEQFNFTTLDLDSELSAARGLNTELNAVIDQVLGGDTDAK